MAMTKTLNTCSVLSRRTDLTLEDALALIIDFRDDLRDMAGSADQLPVADQNEFVRRLSACNQFLITLNSRKAEDINALVSEDQSARFSRQVEKLQNGIDLCESSLAAVSSELLALERITQELAEKVEALRTEKQLLEEKRRTSGALQSDCEALEEEIAHLQSAALDPHIFAEKKNELQETRDRIRESNHAQRDELGKLNGEIADLQAGQLRISADIDARSAEIHDLEESVTALREELEERNAALLSLQEDKEELDGQIGETNGRIDEIQTWLDSDPLAPVWEEHDRLAGEKSTLEDTIAELTRENGEMTQQIEAEENRKAALEEEQVGLQSRVDDLKTHSEEILAAIHEKENEHTLLLSHAEENLKKLNQLQSEGHKNELDSLRRRIAQYRGVWKLFMEDTAFIPDGGPSAEEIRERTEVLDSELKRLGEALAAFSGNYDAFTVELGNVSKAPPKV